MQFDELLTTRQFWEQIWFNSKRKDRDLPEPVKLHQPHLIPGTVALADITEQTRVYHYTGSSVKVGLKATNFQFYKVEKISMLIFEKFDRSKKKNSVLFLTKSKLGFWF